MTNEKKRALRESLERTVDAMVDILIKTERDVSYDGTIRRESTLYKLEDLEGWIKRLKEAERNAATNDSATA